MKNDSFSGGMRMKNRCEAPIGVFDSGVGGLTVVREIMRESSK